MPLTEKKAQNLSMMPCAECGDLACYGNSKAKVYCKDCVEDAED